MVVVVVVGRGSFSSAKNGLGRYPGHNIFFFLPYFVFPFLSIFCLCCCHGGITFQRCCPSNNNCDIYVCMFLCIATATRVCIVPMIV